MAYTRVRCPHCSIILDVPESYTGTKIRCGNCKKGFGIPSISVDEILDTIRKDDSVGGDEIDEQAAAVSPEPTEDKPVEAAPVQQRQAPEPDKEEAKGEKQEPAEDEHKAKPEEEPDEAMEDAEAEARWVSQEGDAMPTGFGVVDIGKLGVLFEFPASLLKDENFRARMPRSCLRCGAKSFLNTHLVIFEHDIKDSVAVEDNHLPKKILLKDSEIKRSEPGEMLKKLPPLENLPEPLNLPMPFWVCDLCEPKRLLYARGDFNQETKEGTCRIRIKRLKSAEEFLCDIGGRDSVPHRELMTAIETHPETPWDQLPRTTQQRLLEWYKPLNKERYVLYIPDRAYSKSEHGTAGILVTSRRLLYRTTRRYQELQKGESLKLSFSMSGKDMHLNILGTNWQVKQMLTDKASLMKLRRSLTKERFEAVWE